jgi:hypothetical protein
MENNNFTQLCVWQGVLLDGFTIQEFDNYMFDCFGTRIKYETEVRTLPDLDESGNQIPETGGRNDVFFYAHADDIEKFAVPRLKAGIRWWEDVVGYNDNSHIYPKDILDKYKLTW